LVNCRQKENFNLHNDADYRTLLADYQEAYGAKLPDLETVSQEIAYEYYLIVIKSLLATLKEFPCHQNQYFTDLLN
jgi:hypothetical protein